MNALGWAAAAVPALGDHPQNILNKQLIERWQLLVAIFWSKLGTPTPNAESGTVDEINHFIRLKGPGRVLLYFCTRPVPQRRLDLAELARLQAYKNDVRSRGYYYEHLDGKVAEYLAGRLPRPPAVQ